jgi:tetratricopeptide (TPR) repeat protein/DNA-binding CsgD family transcriptional regulator
MHGCIDSITGRTRRPRMTHGVEDPGLTGRELDIVREMYRPVAEGTSPRLAANRDIADRLFIDVGTVKTHCKNIYRKLGVPGSGDKRAYIREFVERQGMFPRHAGAQAADVERPDGSPRRPVSSLETGSARLVGRDDVLGAVGGFLRPRPDSVSGPVTLCIHGMPGVGKSALALQAARLAEAEGWFAGGLVGLDLYGYDPRRRLDLAQAAGELLRTIGVADEAVPDSVDARVRLYHSELADFARRGEPLLIVADNVASASDVKRLLPGVQAHRFLVTSRDLLAALDARQVHLSELELDAAVRLVSSMLRAARPDDDRADDSRALEAIARSCGCLPLALEIVANVLKADPGLDASTLATELAEERTRLQRLAYAEGDDLDSSVESAFWMSYNRLADDQKRLFRLLALNPGPDISTKAAQALADTPPGHIRELAQLARASLVLEHPTGSGRWKMHDLTRLYAHGRLKTESTLDESESAFERLLDHYVALAKAADARLSSSDADPSRDDAVTQVDDEWQNLVAAVSAAAARSRPALAVRLHHHLSPYLLRTRRFEELVACSSVSEIAARMDHDRTAEAEALNRLGEALWAQRRFAGSVEAHERAARVYRDLGDASGEATALMDLGAALRDMRRPVAALDPLRSAATLFGELGDHRSRASALTQLGHACEAAGRLPEAIEAYREAVRLCEREQTVLGAAFAKTNLGTALRVAGDLDAAEPLLGEAVDLFVSIDHVHGEAIGLTNLGIALTHRGEYARAESALRRAAERYADADDAHGEAGALLNLGEALRRAGQPHAALDVIVPATHTVRELEDTHRQAVGLSYLGEALMDANDPEGAIEVLEEAATIFRTHGNDRHGGRVHTLLEAARSARCS